MKRFLIAVLILLICFSAGAESSLSGMTVEELNALKAQIDRELLLRSSPEYIAERARDALVEHWKTEVYGENPSLYEGKTTSIEIRSTRVFSICPAPVDEEDRPQQYFEDMAYVVEFVLFSNSHGEAPYAFNSGWKDHVIVSRNGEMRVDTSPFRVYSSRTDRYDFSGIIDNLYDLGTSLNALYDLQAEAP